MNKPKRILCLDFDDVIMRTKTVIEPIIARIEPLATEAYLISISDDFRNGKIDAEEKQARTTIHFDYKDRVLEEFDDKYKNRINYERVININNVYNGAVEYVNYLCNCGLYDKVYIVSHYNVDREVDAKRKFIDKYLPKVEFVPVPFHIETYEEGKIRKRTNKASFLKQHAKLDSIDYRFTLVDDSMGNGVDWRKAGGIFIKYNPYGVNNYPHEVGSLLPLDIQTLSELPRLESGEQSRKR